MKESRPSPAMLRLIDQAERAGQQLTGMLGDMLEVECRATDPERPAAPDPAEETAPKGFRLQSVASSMRDLFGPVAARNGVDFKVSVTGDAPDRATGDGRRLQRALAHLCGHVLDRAGVKDVALDIAHDGAECRAELAFTPPPGGAAALGLDEVSGSAPAADAPLGGHGLGPLLAKGLLESMGGRLEVSTLESGRVMILAATPSEAVSEPRPRVRVVAQSRSLGALGSAAAAAAGVDVLSLDQAPDPDVVLIEAGGDEEAQAVRDSRRMWPDALLIALGAPDAPALFDDVVGPPLLPQRVSETVDAAWRRRESGASAPQVQAFAAQAR